MLPLTNSDDILGRSSAFLGDCILTPTAPLLTIFATNEIDLRAGTGHTFISYVTYSAGGPRFPVAMSLGSAPAPADWAFALDLTTREPGPGVIYAPQGAPIYPNGIPFMVSVVSLAGPLAFPTPITVTAYGFYW